MPLDIYAKTTSRGLCIAYNTLRMLVLFTELMLLHLVSVPVVVYLIFHTLSNYEIVKNMIQLF
jgi:hypothetical protein